MDDNKNYFDDDEIFETEVDWWKIFKNPHRWAPLYFIVTIVLIVTCGSYFVTNFNTIFENKHAPMPDTTANEATGELAMKRASLSEGLDINLYYVPSDTLLARGKELYDVNCFACHGTEGDGQGPAGVALNPKPRSFKNPEGWTNGRRIVDIFKTLKEGIPKNGMLAYDFMPPADRFAMIHYVRSFAGDYPEPTPDEIAMADTVHSISLGDSIPAQIPVALAMEKVIAEDSTIKANIDDILEYVGVYNERPGARIFDLVSTDKRKSLEVLSRSTAWRNNFNNFTAIITSNLLDNGFCSVASRLSTRQWATLHSYMAELFTE